MMLKKLLVNRHLGEEISLMLLKEASTELRREEARLLRKACVVEHITLSEDQMVMAMLSGDHNFPMETHVYLLVLICNHI